MLSRVEWSKKAICISCPHELSILLAFGNKESLEFQMFRTRGDEIYLNKSMPLEFQVPTSMDSCKHC